MAIELTLLGQLEKLAPDNPRNIQPYLLYHQWRTSEALKRSPLVVNTYNTGTGKTRASLLHLFELAQDGESHVLFIAPTNELLHQHVDDISAFVAEHNLPFRVLELNASLLRQLADPEVVDRQGERLTRLLRNPLDFHAQLGLDPSDQRKLNYILVTNPDLFYYAFYWRFSAADQRNLFQAIVTRFRYIVIDEFHYYNSKQLANFLTFMLLSREFGYFVGGERQLCLLSATPTEQTIVYLNKIFGDEGWQLVSPENEPADAQTLAQVPVLAPLQLTIQVGTIDDYAQSNTAIIRHWLATDQDGAVISSALWKVNRAYAALRHSIADSMMGRITGAQPTAERRGDQHKQLILATPTVDIGYNFLKHGKDRQNLDFVVFDARFRDEFIQRMGRAGRVLGKTETTTVSHAVALLSEEEVASFATLHGKTITRKEFTSFLYTKSTVLAKEEFSTYLRAGGMIENAYPIFRAREMFALSDEVILIQLFDALKQVFAPDSGWTYQGIRGCLKTNTTIEQWLTKPKDVQPASLSTLMAKFLGWSMGQTALEDEVRENIPGLLANKQLQIAFRWWCEMQCAIIRAHFSFRDSFSGPIASVFDPAHLLSGATATEYDLIHIVENFHFESIADDLFFAKTGQHPVQDSLCVWLKAHRQQRQRVELQWKPPHVRHATWDRPSFERCFSAGSPVGLQGVVLVTDEPLPNDFRTSLAAIYIPALLIPAELLGSFLRVGQPRGVYSRNLLAQLDTEIQFNVVLGTNALLLAPLLKWAFDLHGRKTDSAIIC